MPALALQGVLGLLADWLPLLALLAAAINLLWKWINPSNSEVKVEVADIILLGAVPLVVMIVLHVLITLLLPLRWHKIRGHFRKNCLSVSSRSLSGIYAPTSGGCGGAAA